MRTRTLDQKEALDLVLNDKLTADHTLVMITNGYMKRYPAQNMSHESKGFRFWDGSDYTHYNWIVAYLRRGVARIEVTEAAAVNRLVEVGEVSE